MFSNHTPRRITHIYRLARDHKAVWRVLYDLGGNSYSDLRERGITKTTSTIERAAGCRLTVAGRRTIESNTFSNGGEQLATDVVQPTATED